MRSLVETYARAKSRADVDAALAVCHPSFVLDTPSFGIASGDRADTVGHLAGFFHAFPDYGVTTDALTFGTATAGWWGTARMTFRGDFLELAATNRTAEIPAFSAFEFADDRIVRERFFIDLAMLCDGIGVGVDTMRAALGRIRAAA
jgi:hypothetical protein